MLKTEVLIIGSGPGGYTAAIRLAQLGKKVLVVEKDKLGGTCLNYGCIPSKALISTAGLFHKVKQMQDMGLEPGNLSINFEKLQTWKGRLVQSLNQSLEGLLKGNGITVIRGEAAFSGPGQAKIKTPEGAEDVSFNHAVIATGSQQAEIPGFKVDGTIVVGSREALEFTQPPKSLLVLGAGAIGLEIGTFYAKLGSAVAVVEIMPQILPGTDSDLLGPVTRSLERLKIKVFLNTQALGYEAMGAEAVVKLKTSEGEIEMLAEKILLSVGRRPDTTGLGLDKAAVRLDAKGFVEVDEKKQTTASNIFAIGDVTPGPLLAHRASHEGILVAEVIAGGKKEHGKHSLPGPMPSAVFTDPEVATVGLTEKEAREKGLSLAVGRFPFAASGRALAGGYSDGFVKVIVDKQTRKILGVGIVGPQASDLISETSLAIRMGATVDDISSTIHPHPTLPEAFAEAGQAAFGEAINILSRRSRS